MTYRIVTQDCVRDKVVALRVDFNVPNDGHIVLENTRIVEALPTIKLILDGGAKRVHIMAHLGRPKGERSAEFSLNIVKPELEKLLGQKVELREDYTAGVGRIQLHENVRYYEGEESNDPALVQQMMDGIQPDIFVNDGFGVSHRAHASVVGLAEHIPSYGGLLIQKEMQHLAPFLSDAKMAGLTVMIGGAKIDTKIAVLKHFAQTAENLIVGGALGNTFLAARGYDVGASLYQESRLEVAQEIMELVHECKTGFHRPIDVVCADSLETHDAVNVPIEDIMGGMQVFDLGPRSIASYKEILAHSKTIIWNGPVGCFEYDTFERGTRELLSFIAELTPKGIQTILGGGDTIDALKKFDIAQSAFTHVSTGGGAMLEFLEGKELPGIAILED